MTLEQAFEKWWDKVKNRCSGTADSYSPWFSHECAFIAGQQYQETNQLMALSDIRKAVGDGEGRLTQEELVKRIEELVSPWRDIESAPKDSKILISNANWPTPVRVGYWSDDFHEWRDHGAIFLQPTHWMPLAAVPVKSVTTEKEEA